MGTSIGIAVITAAVFVSLQVAAWSTAVAVGFSLIALVVLSALLVAYKDQRDRRAGGAPLS